MSQPETYIQHYLANAQKYGDTKVAVRQKELGIWQEYTWADCLQEVETFALGLLTLGMKRGDHVSAIGDNDKEYLWGYLSAMANGGAIIGLYTDANADEAAYVINHSDSRYVLAQDQEQVDKMLEIRDKIPQVEKVIYWDEAGLWGYQDDWLISYKAIRALGKTAAAKQPDRFINEVNQGSGQDIALISYTSGTTGLPKGALLTHNNLIKAAEIFDEVDARYDTDNHVSFLPLGWISEHILGFGSHCRYGFIINFPEEPETVRQNVREISPEVIVYNSRLWDNLVSMIQVRMLDATKINQLLYKTLMPIGYRAAEKQMQGETLGFGLSLSNYVADTLLFAPLRDQLGLSNVRQALTGGAALSPDVIKFFHAIGVNLKQVYGMTEICTAGTGHRTGDIKVASIGQPLPGVDVRIAEGSGEIQISSPTLFQGYYKAPEKTAEDVTTDSDGKRWFKTGDAGYIDEDGHVIYLDRVKDMITLSPKTAGARFSPQFIEGRLKFSPYIKDVMAIGDTTRDYVSAMIIIEFDNVARWAEKKGIGFTTFADLTQKPQTLGLIQQAVEEVNETLPENGQVKTFVLMHKEFDADEAEMTRSRKLKRQVLQDNYSDIITALYGSQPAVSVKSTVTYQDGTTSELSNELVVVKL